MIPFSKVCWTEHEKWYTTNHNFQGPSKYTEEKCKDICGQNKECNMVQYLANKTCLVPKLQVISLGSFEFREGAKAIFKRRCGEEFDRLDADYYRADKLEKKN